MFLLRSAFWLTAAYLVMTPNVELDTGAITGEAIAASQQLIAGSMREGSCGPLSCMDGAAVLSLLTSTPSRDATMQDSPHSTVPLPRERPDWMG